MPRPARAPRPRTPSRGRRESSGRSTDSQLKKSIAGGSGGAAGIATALPRAGASSPGRMTRWLESERLLATLLLAPAVLLLGLFIAYPFIMGVWLSLSNTSVGNVGEFVWFRNFVKAWNDSIFRTAFWNTSFYTFWATIFKLSLGMWLALLLNRSFRGKRIVRASMLLPFIVPTVLSTFAWRWMFVQTFSDFQLIYVLTGGGPANATHLLATYAYQIGIATGPLGEGAAISLFMLPVLFIVVWVQLRYLRRLEGA